MKTPLEKAKDYINYLNFKYAKYYQLWDGKVKDDRQVFCNIYRQLIEAYTQLGEGNITNPCVWVALNNYKEEEIRKLEDVIERHKNGIFKSI